MRALATFLATLVLLSTSVAFPQTSNTAVTLALRAQQGIFLDSSFARRIDSGLVAARTVDDTVSGIGAFPDYSPRTLRVRVTAPWSERWRQGILATGEHFIDSLSQVFGLESIDATDAPRFSLFFNRPLHIPRLAQRYGSHPDVIYATANGLLGDGHRIEFFEKNGTMHFSFSSGWGDCPAGCIDRHYWYVSVGRSENGWGGVLEESWFRSWSPRITRWNNPARYAMTHFPSADSVLATFNHPLWWHRKHAIEGVWRFFTYNRPWSGGEDNPFWFELRSQVLARQTQIIPMLLNLVRNDPDADVRASADTALARIRGTMVQRNYDFKKTGFSMKLQMNNVGALGRIAYPPFSPFPNPPVDSIGLEYPAGVEHLYGGGVWIAGKLDTARIGTGTERKLVSLTYEGWTGPYHEFYPGTNSADSFWVTNRSMTSPPPGWYEYWGSSLPFNPISDHDLHCTYTDTAVSVSGHVPLRLKVIQSSHAWNHSSAEAIIIVEYKIINMGTKPISGAHVGVFLETSIDGTGISDYVGGIHTAFRYDAVGATSSPIGIRILDASRPLDSLKYTFQWFPGPQTPPSDLTKYNMLSSGVIDPPEWPPTEAQMVVGAGPFTMRPSTDPTPDTVKFVIAIVSGNNVAELLSNAEQALVIYNNPPTSVKEGSTEIPAEFSLHQNYPNPFNPGTTISFIIPHSSFITLKVYNMLGQEVRTLVNEKREVGEHHVAFDAEGLPSGVYVYRLQAGSHVASGKAMLLK